LSSEIHTDTRRTDEPATTFASFGLHPDLMRGVETMGFSIPTPIQAISIPPLMLGRDVLAAAATGSGKTAAFMLPILHRLMDKPRGKTRVLVLAPTRELAAQIAEHMGELARHTRLKGAAVFGGVGMAPQIDAFRRGVDVIVATPGRLLDHLQHDYARLDGLEVLVLDEADRMLDMGFLPDVRRVIAKLPSRRQTMLFSATMPDPIVQLSRDLLRDAIPLNIHRKAAPAPKISHAVYPVPGDMKSSLLVALLESTPYDSVLAFTRTKHRANRLADLLEKKGIACTRIHGNRSQTRRTEALSGFKNGSFRVMVATDIAARGIDIEELALVVNFDVPHMPEDYIHRVGRTARADAKGLAITLVSPEEEGDLRGIEKQLNMRLPRLRMEGFDYQRRPEDRFEVPIGERIAEIRKRKAEERERARANAERRAANLARQAPQEPARQPRQDSNDRTRPEAAPRRAAAGPSYSSHRYRSGR
jgi:ATP-dependent RNA helicase RhlE